MMPVLRRFAGGKRRIAAAGVAALALVPAVGVLAYWTAAGSGAASATVLSIASPVVDATNPIPGTAHVEWTAVASPDENHDPELAYTVERKLSSGSTWIFVCGTGTTPKAYDELSCDDHPTAEDDYDYRVTAMFRSWTSEGIDTVHVVTDVTPPQVVSIARDDPSPTNAATVAWTVTFSEDVTGVEATDFVLAGSGVTNASITSVTGSGDEYTVAVSVGADGTLRLDLVDDDSVRDVANNRLGGTGAGNGSFTGQAYVIDRTAPSVSSIARDDANPTNAPSVSWTVSFSENVTGVDAGDFTFTASGLNGTPAVGTVTPVNGQTYTVAASTGTGTPGGSGTLRLDLVDDDSIADGIGNELGGTGAGNGNFTAGQAYAIDKTAPTVSSIDRSGTSPTNAGPLTWQVVFSEPVANVGASNFSLATANVAGASPAVSAVTAVGGAPATTWNVSVSTASTTGQNNGSIRLDLSSVGAIQDPATNGLANTLTGQAYAYDTTQPTVSSIARTAANPANAGPLTWQVTFSEPVSNVTVANFSVTTQNTGGSSPTVSSVTPSGSAPTATWTVSVSTAGTTGANDGSIRLDLSTVGTIRDAATNLLAATFTGGQAYTYDTTPPTVSSMARSGASPTNAGSVSWTVTFSESVSGVNAADFALAASGVSGASITSVTGTGPYTVTANTGSGSGSIGLNLVDDDSIQDEATNRLGGTGAGNGNATGEVFTIDKTPPTVSSIDRAAASPTNASSVSWTVTFSEDVTGVATGNFTLVNGGLGGSPAITGVSGGGTTWNVTASTGTGNGTLGLNLTSSGSIQDGVGNGLGGSIPVSGQVYTVDRTAPALTTLEMLDTNANGRVDQVKAAFSESLEPYTAGNAPWTLSNVPSAGSLESVAVSGTVATLTVTEGAGAANTAVGSFRVALAASATGVRDAAGNQSSFAATGPADKAGPVLTTAADTNGTTDGLMQAGDSVAFTFSEPLAVATVPSSVTVREERSGQSALTISGLLASAVSIPNGYLGGNNSSGTATGTVALSAGNTVVTVTLSTVTTTGSGVAAGPAQALSFTPNAALKDGAGNAAAGSFATAGTFKLF
jgi:hypothetical protein